MSTDDEFFDLPKARSLKPEQMEAGGRPGAFSDDAGSAEHAVSARKTGMRKEPVLPRASAGGQAQTPPIESDPPDLPRNGLWFWSFLGSGLLVVVMVGGLIGYWVFINIAARLVLENQPITVALPQKTEMELRAKRNIDARLSGQIRAQVPLRQTLNLPVKGHYDTIIDLDTTTRLNTVIVYEGVIPVDTFADIEANASVNFQNVKRYKRLKVKAKLPMKLNIPVKLTVPVDQDVRLKYRGPLKVFIDHVIRAPMDTTLNTALKVDQVFNVPIRSKIPLDMTLPSTPVNAHIDDADLFLDLSTFRLERKPENSE